MSNTRVKDVAPESGSEVTEYMNTAGYQGEKPRRSRKRLYLILAAIITVVALGIGLGVGLGLGLHKDAADEDDNSGSGRTGGNTSPTPTGNFSGRVFWQPAANTSWQIVLLNPITIDADATTTTPDVSVFDIDMFTNTQDTINKLHSLGKKVICYFSAGSYEPNRPDSAQFTAADQGSTLDGWPDEKWLNLSSPNVRNIMAARIQYASNKGCDAIDPDNVDGYSNSNGLGLTMQNSVDFMQFLSNEAQKYNMSTGLKNAKDIIPQVLNVTHFQVNEQCAQYSECEGFSAYIAADKPVFHIEYPKDAPSVSADTVTGLCSNSGKSAGSAKFSTVIKKMKLDGWVEYCNGAIATTATNGTSSSD